MQFDFKKIFKRFIKSIPDTQRKVVGIDFGSASVKVVELEERDNFIVLKTYGELQLGPYADQPLGTVCTLSLEKRTEALIDVMREAGVNADKGLLALPLSASFVTVITINAKPDEDLNPRVQAEARKYIPVPLKEVALEWKELPPDAGAPENERLTLIAAVQNQSYQEMSQLLRSVDLASQPTEIELFCTQRAVTDATAVSEAIAVIDFGAQTSKLYIIKDGSIRKIHRVFAGGSQLTQALASTLSVPFEEAENIKRDNDISPENAAILKKELAEVYTRPLQEFRRVLQQFQEKSGVPVGAIYCSGGAAALADIPLLAKQILDQDVQKTNAFKKVAFPAFMEDMLNDIAPSFTVALGAALRHFEE